MQSGPLHRLLFVAVAAGAVSTAYVQTEPAISDAQLRLRSAELTLRSDEVTFAAMAQLRAEERRLRIRFGREFGIDPQARTLRALALVTRRHHLDFSSSQSAPGMPEGRAKPNEFEDVHLNLELRGRYRDALAAIDELTRDCQIVRVESATLHRSAETLVLDLSIAILRWNASPSSGTPA